MIFFEISVIKIVSGDIYIPNNIMEKAFAKIFSLRGRNDRQAQCAPPFRIGCEIPQS